MFSTITSYAPSLGNLKTYITTTTEQITQSYPQIQNVKEKVTSIPTQTKDYFYPSPDEFEMKSVVRLDDNFFVHKDIEEYITPGQDIMNTSHNNHIKHNNLNIIQSNDIPIKPSAVASDIIAWHDFELCVEDEALFDETETGSYTTYTTQATGTTFTSNIHPNNTHPSILDDNNHKQNDDDDDDNQYMDGTHVKTESMLNLDEEDGKIFFKELHEFRQSIISSRKASRAWVGDEMDIATDTAPPTLKSNNSYQKRLADLDQQEDDEQNDDDDPASISPQIIAPSSDTNNRNTMPNNIHHAIEGSKDLGVDGVRVLVGDDDDVNSTDDKIRRLSGIGCVNDDDIADYDDDDDDDLPQGKARGKNPSIQWLMERHDSKVYASGDIMFNNGNDMNDQNAKGMNATQPSKTMIVKGNSLLDAEQINELMVSDDPSPSPFDDTDHSQQFNDSDEMDYSELQNKYAVERGLDKPRGSMRVGRISVSNEMREALEHSKSISTGNVMNMSMNSIHNELPPKADNSPSSPTSNSSSFDQKQQHEVNNYVKRISLTPRGVDPDNAQVEAFDFGDIEHLTAEAQQHRRSSSMDTQPDQDEDAPYMNSAQRDRIREEEDELNAQLDIGNIEDLDDAFNDDDQINAPPLHDQGTVLIRSIGYEDDDVADSDDNRLKNGSNSNDNNGNNNKTKEGWEQPTGYQENVNDDNDMDDVDIEHNEDEKYEELPLNGMNDLSDDDFDGSSVTYNGYTQGTGTTQGHPSMNTLGGNMLSVLKYIPWSEEEYLPQELDESHDERLYPRFAINKELNEIIKFFKTGDALIKCDALVVPVTEDWTPTSQISHMLMNNAGSAYLEHIYEFKKMGDYVSTGDAMYIPSFNLPCNYIVHTSPPCYDDRYPVASENAMHSCYWRSLQIGHDLKCKSIVFPAIYPDKFFSQQLAIHILSRTIRRFLEKQLSLNDNDGIGNGNKRRNEFDSVVICVESEEEMQLYTRIFTIYFPRDEIDLKYSKKYMPAYTGNEYGGTTVKLRKYEIALSPLHFMVERQDDALRESGVINNHFGRSHGHVNGAVNNRGTYTTHGGGGMSRNGHGRIDLRSAYIKQIDYETYDIYGNLRESIHEMAEYKEQPEKIWQTAEDKKWSWQKLEESFDIKYRRYWNRCRKLNLKDIDLFQFCYVGGQDRDGRDIVVFVGNRFPAKQLIDAKKLKKSLLYIIRELHYIVDKEYVVLYLHSGVEEDTHLPPISWINQCFQICSTHFAKNLHAFFVVHPNFRLKSWFYVLCAKSFWNRLIYLDSITQLESHNIDLEQVALPGKSWEYERELFGEDKLAEKMALVADDLVLDALPYH